MARHGQQQVSYEALELLQAVAVVVRARLELQIRQRRLKQNHRQNAELKTAL